jgi:hypothetical protein
MRRSVWIGVCLVILAASPADSGQVAQTEAALKKYFEGKTVALKIDMPGSSDGVNVPIDRPFNQREYQDRLGRYGTALRAGDRVQVTLVKVKDNNVEFQLAGGGYGTFSDDTSTSANLPDMEKSNREKDLEKAVGAEKDPAKKRTLERELQDLRNYRERENRRIAAERRIIEDQKRRELAERRLAGGSRFNLRFQGPVPAVLKPEDVVSALSEYADFSAMNAEPTVRRGDTTSPNAPHKGMLRADAERRFGVPVDVTQRREGTLTVHTLTFVRGTERITAEFVEDVMIRFVIGRR